jgi:hypothetical protein
MPNMKDVCHYYFQNGVKNVYQNVHQRWSDTSFLLNAEIASKSEYHVPKVTYIIAPL